MNSYIPLDTVRIASPCTTSWEGMSGDDRVRHCSECSLSVYNISEMTRAEAETLISGAEGRLCIRMYRRADGTIITQDCPVGSQAIRVRTLRKIRAVAATALTFIGAMGVSQAQPRMDIMGKMAPVEVEAQVQPDTLAQARPDTVVAEEPVHVMMGGMAMPVTIDVVETPVETVVETPVDTPTEPVDDTRFYEVMGEMDYRPEPPADTVVLQSVVQQPVDLLVNIDAIHPATVLPVDQPLPAIDPVVDESIAVEPRRDNPWIR